ncbi:protein G12-like [Apis florea]|uniref:protein G12-like n=1 Tax=Apis florea TaxID=7463 RepID=UPI0006293414|nr:protein G12-like [Apis florea]
MKFIFGIVTLIAAVGHLNAHVVPNLGSGALAQEFQYFLNIIPIDDVIELTKAYLVRDKEFQWIMSFIQYDDIKNYIEDLENMMEFKDLMNYLQNNGLDAYVILNELKDSLKEEQVVVSSDSQIKITGGIEGFIKDLSTILPVFDWMNMYEYKIETSDVFRNFVEELFDSQYEVLFTSTFTNVHFQRMLKQLKYLNVDSETFHINFVTLLSIKELIHYYF